MTMKGVVLVLIFTSRFSHAYIQFIPKYTTGDRKYSGNTENTMIPLQGGGGDLPRHHPPGSATEKVSYEVAITRFTGTCRAVHKATVTGRKTIKSEHALREMVWMCNHSHSAVPYRGHYLTIPLVLSHGGFSQVKIASSRDISLKTY